MIGKIKKYIKNIYRYMHDGGVVYTSIELCNPGERLKGRKVLVTGGTSGIGLAIAKECLAEGADVLVCARRQNIIDSTLQEISNPHLKGLAWDVADVKSIPQKMEAAISMMGYFDVFINCAGVSDFAGCKMKEEETYDYILDINTKGLYFMCHAESQYFLQNRRQGKIVNITSACGDNPGFDPYTISKWGANCLTKGLARAMIQYGITVNGIAPGEVPTNITAHLQNLMNTDNQYTPLHQTKRLTNAREVARVAVYLASQESNNVVGQIIKISGSEI
jgi:NAD(P)-dependent dehydrogenase (short-subunit alcohol dehydrogenase family)